MSTHSRARAWAPSSDATAPGRRAVLIGALAAGTTGVVLADTGKPGVVPA